jgi:FtsP/CotA-like multicopper oxidase with cupredoxin domain
MSQDMPKQDSNLEASLHTEMPSQYINRRQFLSYGLGTVATLALGRALLARRQLAISTATNPYSATQTLAVSDIQPSSTTQLEAQVTPYTFHPDFVPTQIWSFAQGMSPVLRFQQGEEASIAVRNRLQEALTVHWHGLRVPNPMDGVGHLTQAPIEPDGSFVYTFDTLDAGTYWYHTHSNSQEQLSRGLAGAFIVDEATPPDIDHDVIVLLQDWRLDRQHQIQDDFYNPHDLSHEGRLGNVVTVNGQIQPRQSYRPHSRLRLRFINASSARMYRPSLPAEWSAWTLALDGQPVAIEPYTPPILGPGMRAEVIADIPTTGTYSIVDTAYDTQSVMEIVAEGASRRERTTAPEPLAANPIALPEANQDNLELRLEGGAMSGMMGGGMMRGRMMGGARGVWQLNDTSMSEVASNAPPMFTLSQGRSYRMTITNNTAFIHPMHLHGHSFQILNPAQLVAGNHTSSQTRLSDTVLLFPQERTEIAFVADNPGDWLLHCHVLGHQAAGMMGIVRVVA